MSNLFCIAMVGFLIGMRHAIDPDHVVAVATIVSQRRNNWHAALIGGFWGLGHSLTILVVGGAIILLNWVIPSRLGLSMELSVGVMLILLGSWNLRTLWSSNTNTQLGGVHLHDHAILEPGSGIVHLRELMRPLAVGIVHGLAGSSAVALLVLATIRNTGIAIFYLLMFALGTMAGMILISSAIAIPFSHCKSSRRLNHGVRAVAGIASIAFGVLMVHQIIATSDLLPIGP